MQILLLMMCGLCADPADVSALEKSLYAKNRPEAQAALKALENLAEGDSGKNASARTVLANYKERRRVFLNKFMPIDSSRYKTLYISGREAMEPADLALLFCLPDIAAVSVDNPHFGDAHFEYILQWKGLGSLAIVGTGFTGVGLENFDASRLTMLTLERSPVTDKAMCALDPVLWPQLEILNLIGTKITNETIAKCAVTHVVALYVYETAVDRDGLADLWRFTALESLRIDVEQFHPRLFRWSASRELPLDSMRLRYYDENQKKIAEEIQKEKPMGFSLMIFPAPKRM